MKKILLSTLVLGTMSSFALAGEPAKLDESQLRSVNAGSWSRTAAAASPRRDSLWPPPRSRSSSA